MLWERKPPDKLQERRERETVGRKALLDSEDRKKPGAKAVSLFHTALWRAIMETKSTNHIVSRRRGRMPGIHTTSSVTPTYSRGNPYPPASA